MFLQLKLINRLFSAANVYVYKDILLISSPVNTEYIPTLVYEIFINQHF